MADATVYLLIFGWTLSPASRSISSWFMTWSTSVARVSLDKFGPLLPLPCSPPASGLPLPLPPPRPLPLAGPPPLPLPPSSPLWIPPLSLIHTLLTPSILVKGKWTYLLHFYSAWTWLVCLQLSNHVLVHLMAVFTDWLIGVVICQCFVNHCVLFCKKSEADIVLIVVHIWAIFCFLSLRFW